MFYFPFPFSFFLRIKKCRKKKRKGCELKNQKHKKKKEKQLILPVNTISGRLPPSFILCCCSFLSESVHICAKSYYKLVTLPLFDGKAFHSFSGILVNILYINMRYPRIFPCFFLFLLKEGEPPLFSGHLYGTYMKKQLYTMDIVYEYSFSMQNTANPTTITTLAQRTR